MRVVPDAGGGRADKVVMSPEPLPEGTDAALSFGFQSETLTVAGTYVVSADYEESRDHLTRVRPSSEVFCEPSQFCTCCCLCLRPRVGAARDFGPVRGHGGGPVLADATQAGPRSA